MTFQPFKPGGFAIGERFKSQEHANAINRDLPRAVDGYDGGNYDPSSPIVIGGAGIRTTVPPSNSADVANKAYVDLGPKFVQLVIANGAAAENPAVWQLSSRNSPDHDVIVEDGTHLNLPLGFWFIQCTLSVGSENTTTNPLAVTARLQQEGTMTVEVMSHGVRYSTAPQDRIHLSMAGIFHIQSRAVDRVSVDFLHDRPLVSTLTGSSMTCIRLSPAR